MNYSQETSLRSNTFVSFTTLYRSWQMTEDPNSGLMYSVFGILLGEIKEGEGYS